MGERGFDWQRVRRLSAWCVAGVLWCAPASTQTTERSEPTRPNFAVTAMSSDWRVTIGGTLTTFATYAAWAPRGLAGAAIDLEDALGLDEQTGTFVVAAEHRFNRKHAIVLSVTELGRTATRALDGEFDWGDYIFRAKGTVATDLVTNIVKLTWRYDFSDMDRLNAGFLVGLSTFDLGLTLSGEARLESDAGDEWVEGIVEGASAIAPIPVVGFFLDYALSPRWVLRFDADVIDLSIGSHSGRVLESDFAFEYVATGWLSFGVSLGGTDLEYQSEDRSEKFGLRYRFNYIGGFASFNF